MNSDIRPDKTSPAYLNKSSSGGLLVGFIYILVFMSILSLAMWQSFESKATKTMLKTQLRLHPRCQSAARSHQRHPRNLYWISGTLVSGESVLALGITLRSLTLQKGTIPILRVRGSP